MTTRRTLLICLMFGAAACASMRKPAEKPTRAPLFSDLGNHHHAITARSELAQRYFDQGLTLSYGFNHAEGARSFREATHIDPDCAMCYWGLALVLGPNINMPMDPGEVSTAYEASQKALSLADKVSANERAYIEAITKRYAAEASEDREPLDAAYAEAMCAVAHAYPDDLDAATLCAEAMMDCHPWDYWHRDGRPQPWTEEIVSTLESVLARDPNHPGAIHFYIHATEASRDPGRAAPYADRLGDLVPGAGHLVHTPSHTYIRVGRYHDASVVNMRAAQADQSYVSQCRAQGVYPLAYVPHNHHFLAVAASMEGWSAKAIEAALMTDAKTQHELMGEPGLAALQHYSLVPLYIYVRFGKWDEILAHPAPPAEYLYPTGIWHYARGRALVGKGALPDAERELSALRTIAANKEMEKITLFDVNSAASLLRVATEVLAGEIEARRHRWNAAIRHLHAAVRREDALRYQEPEDWQYPTRHSLGAVLIEAGRPGEAERVYREDLTQNPENGWALYGLMESLRAQGKTAAAAKVEERFRKAWANADVTITASRF